MTLLRASGEAVVLAILLSAVAVANHADDSKVFEEFLDQSNLSQKSSTGTCDYGALPGRASLTENGFQWKICDPDCPLEDLSPRIASLNASASDLFPWRAKRSEGVSMLMIGDSLSRYTLEDLDWLAFKENWTSFDTIHYDHHRVAVRLEHLEAVYHFAPGTHPSGPFPHGFSKDDSMAINVPKAFDLHRAMTGRSGPKIVTFSHILWDEGRLNHMTFLAEQDNKTEEGVPLPRDAEFLPDWIVEEIREDVLVQMIRIEELAGPDALLIYNGAPYPRLAGPSKGTLSTLHRHNHGMLGRRPHIIELNAMAKQLVRERPRWHFVDLGQMTEAFLDSSILRDDVHPKLDFMMTVMQIYLNLHADHGHTLAPVKFDIQDFDEWDSQDFEERHREWEDDFHELKPKWLAEQDEIHRNRRKKMSRQPIDDPTDDSDDPTDDSDDPTDDSDDPIDDSDDPIDDSDDPIDDSDDDTDYSDDSTE